MLELDSRTSKRKSPYKPLQPAFKYFRGKSRERKYIIPIIPDHRTFTEPFAGGASVTLGKPPSEKEVLGSGGVS
jgi:DNA adenine methylase